MSGEPHSAGARTSANPWVIALVVALAAFMEVLDTTIANVALNYIAGGMGVSADEASWVVTSYLVSNAIILTASGFLAGLVGRKRFFLMTSRDLIVNFELRIRQFRNNSFNRKQIVVVCRFSILCECFNDR